MTATFFFLMTFVTFVTFMTFVTVCEFIPHSTLLIRDRYLLTNAHYLLTNAPLLTDNYCKSGLKDVTLRRGGKVVFFLRAGQEKIFLSTGKILGLHDGQAHSPLCGGSDAETVVGTFAHKPADAALGVGHHEL